MMYPSKSIHKSVRANLGGSYGNSHAFFFCIVPLILAPRCFADSLYLTSPVPLPPDDDRYQLIAPYFPELKTRITVSISKGAWNKDLPKDDGSNGGNYGPPVVTISASPVPVARGFLYFTKNPFFSDAANVSISSDGLLSSADSSSTQQITAILTELAQTAAAVHAAAPVGPTTTPSPGIERDARRKCL